MIYDILSSGEVNLLMKKIGIFYHQVCIDKAYFSLFMSVQEQVQSLENEGLLLSLMCLCLSPVQ